MKQLHELISTSDPAWPQVLDWLQKSDRPLEILPPASTRADALLQTQVTTRSPMGAVIYETGGILFDHAWIRLLGSGHPKLTRSLPGWNHTRAQGFCLIADDAAGGFFAINTGALGADLNHIQYFAPDTLKWQPLNCRYTQFLQWLTDGDLEKFYDGLRWPNWSKDISALSADQCLMTYPPLWTKEGRLPSATRKPVPIQEVWDVQMEAKKVVDGNTPAKPA
jgi:hypothetical protein